jgi:hypothetical protein
MLCSNILQVIRYNTNIPAEQDFFKSKPAWKFSILRFIRLVHFTIPKHYEGKKCHHLVQFLDLKALL